MFYEASILSVMSLTMLSSYLVAQNIPRYVTEKVLHLVLKIRLYSFWSDE